VIPKCKIPPYVKQQGEPPTLRIPDIKWLMSMLCRLVSVPKMLKTSKFFYIRKNIWRHIARKEKPSNNVSLYTPGGC